MSATPEAISRRIQATDQLARNLSVPASPRSESTTTYFEIDGRRSNFTFSSTSHSNALAYGYSVENAVMNVDIGTYLAAADAGARISDLNTEMSFDISSGWRPNIGSGAHPNGVGLDISNVHLTREGRLESTPFVDPGKRAGRPPSIPEPVLARDYRESLYQIRQSAGIRQILTPWGMLFSPDGQFRTNQPSRASNDDVDWLHRHHLHIGLKVY